MTAVADPTRWGAWTDGDGFHFGLWAPQATRVEVVFDTGEVHPMQPTDEGFHGVHVACPAGTRYRLRVDGNDPVPDPASRWQPDGVHGPSATLAADHRWRHPDWRGRPWREAVVYELHPGTCGGFDGVRAQLPRLAELGITAIELMPVAERPGTRNWGYDGVLPFAPTASYGSPAALKALIDEAHGLGLMVLLDVVYNHFGPAGNHLPAIAPGFFRDDIDTPWGAAIDFREPAVCAFFLANARMWLDEYRVDGLRLDAVHAIEPQAFLDTLRADVAGWVEPGRHVHLVLENEHNDAGLLARGYSAQWNDDFHNALHVLLTGEREGYYAAFADDPAAKLARALGEGFAFQGEPDHRGNPRGTPSAQLPPERFVVFAQNHDQIGNRALGERLITQVPEARLRAALALTALTPMVPLFFMGEPWGAREPFLFFTDFEPPLDAQVREGRRREFAHFAAFADPAQRERIPDPNDESTFRASVCDIAAMDAGEGARWAQWFRGLLAVRRRWLDGEAGEGRGWVPQPGAVAASWRVGGARWQVFANFGDVPMPLPADAGEVVHGENAGTDATVLPVDGFIACRAELR